MHVRHLVAAVMAAGLLVGCSHHGHPFRSCVEAREAGAPLPLTPADPGWNPALDRDHNGQAC